MQIELDKIGFKLVSFSGIRGLNILMQKSAFKLNKFKP